MIDRKPFTSLDIVKEIWKHLDLPPSALASLSLPEVTEKPVIPSSFKIGHLAQSTIALSALAAATVASSTHGSEVPHTTVPLRHAVLEFQSERLYTLAGNPPVETWGPIGGLHPTADGYVRIHDNFPHHRRGALALLGLPETCVDRAAVSQRTREWKSVELETVAVEQKGLAIYALRSFAEWDALPQARDVPEVPVNIRRLDAQTLMSSDSHPNPNPNPNPTLNINPAPSHIKRRPGGHGPKCLSSLRVLEFSRVIAAPAAGKTLAAHGADVLWVTSPHLPDLPGLDREFARGKKSVRLDLNDAHDKARALTLAQEADVVLQGYRPGSLAARGLGAEELGRVNPGVIVADLSAFGKRGEWCGRRGFDSLVQTASGMNVAEAEHYGMGTGEGEGEGEGNAAVARALPCQALDHGAGYLLAAGVCAAVYHREKDAREGRRVGAYVVDVSLAGVMWYLRSLGQYEGRSGFEGEDYTILGADEVKSEEERGFFETRETPFGEMTFLRHSASIDGFEPGWERMPTPLGACEAVWDGS
ncbi:CoA-transferase family III [Xylaria sp. FL1042]|nr:CoA-transferase family III [Xylaria sp. FL1042]